MITMTMLLCPGEILGCSLLTASFKRPAQNPSSSCRGGEGEGEGEGRYIASSVTSLKETTIAADDVTLSFKLG